MTATLDEAVEEINVPPQECKSTEGPLRGLPLLRGVFKVIDDHPELWDQTSWAQTWTCPVTVEAADAISQDPQSAECGTAGCAAGWACVLGGDPIKFQPYEMSSERTVSGGRIMDVAQEFLGITDHEADLLFAGNNRRDDLQRIGEEIAAARGETL